MKQHIPNNAQSRLVNMFKIVVQGMPNLWKTTIFAFGLQVDDIDGWDTRYLVHSDVVVADGRAQFVGEKRSIAQVVGLAPNLVAYPTGIALGKVFLGKVGVAAAHHVQEDAVVGFVAIHMRLFGPIL